MNARLTRRDAYALGRKCILITNGCVGPSIYVDGEVVDRVGHNEGTLGWNWNAFQIDHGFLFIDGYRNFPKGDNAVLGNRKMAIISDGPSFAHVTDTREHDVWRVTDREGRSFEIDVAPADGPVVVG